MTLNSEPLVDVEPTTTRRKLIALAVGATVLLAGAGAFLLHNRGSADVASGLVAVRPRTDPVVLPVTAKPARKATKPSFVIPVASTVNLGRDPFKALYVVPAVAPAGTTAAAGGVPVSTVPIPGIGTTTGGSTPTPSYSLQLVSITDQASGGPLFVFAYGKVRKTVVVSQKFGRYGELVTLNDLTNGKRVPVAALLQVGDADPVTLKIGEKLTVR
jgi:hypothetical protein